MLDRDRMPYLTVFLLIATPLLTEVMMRTLVPGAWSRVRWAILVGLGVFVGWTVPMRVLPMLPDAEHVLSAALGVAFALLVAAGGWFRDAFWTGPSEADVALTGRRSALAREPMPRMRV